MRAAAALAAICALGGVARAGVEHWRVNEVLASAGGDGRVRFVELHAPPSAAADNCFFPTSRLEILDAAGGVLGQVAPVTTTTCYPGDTYFLFATAEVAAALGVTRDAPLTAALPAAAGQVCFRSSATRYDCARWGAIATAATDLGDPADTSAAPALADGIALARVDTTDVVALDFAFATPTPRAPNDGTPWTPPDAGPTPDAAPDASVTDAPVYDATVWPDAPPRPMSDARPPPPEWWSAEPGGGVVCACRAGARRRGGADAGAVLLALLAVAALTSLRAPSRGA